MNKQEIITHVITVYRMGIPEMKRSCTSEREACQYAIGWLVDGGYMTLEQIQDYVFQGRFDLNDFISEAELYEYDLQILEVHTYEDPCPKLYARQCSKTGEGMNTGYVVNDGELYFKYESDLVEYLRTLDDYKQLSNSNLIEQGYTDGVCYYTEWEDISDYQYIKS